MGRLSISFCFVLAAFPFLQGCSGNPNLSEVQGRVTLDGQPLANAFVVYAPTKGGTTSYGKTDESGQYRMMFKDNEPGAWIGENIVRISTGDVGAGGGSGTKERVPQVYNLQSTLKANVVSGKNTFDFDLKSNAGKIVPTTTD